MPEPDTDVVVSNAVLQWVPSTAAAAALVAALPRGGWLAMQVPGNFGSPSHALSAGCSTSPLAGARGRARRTTRCPSRAATPSCSPARGADADVWETTYLHRLTGPDPVLRVDRGDGAAAGPGVLDRRGMGRAACGARAAAAGRLPSRPDGRTWFGFRRVFAVARVPG